MTGFFYFKQFLNKVLYFKSVMSAGVSCFQIRLGRAEAHDSFMMKLAGPGISASILQPQALLTSVAAVLELCLECVGTNDCFIFWFFFPFCVFPPTSQWDVSVVLTSSSSWCGNRDVLQECCHMTFCVFNVF